MSSKIVPVIQPVPLQTGPPDYETLRTSILEEFGSTVPDELRLPKSLIDNPPKNVTNIPKTCGILTDQEIDITENYDATALAAAIASRKFTSVAVVTAFAKRAIIAHQLTCCLTQWWFKDAVLHAQLLDQYQDNTGMTLGPLHGVPVSIKEHMPASNHWSNVGYLATRKLDKKDCQMVKILRDAGAVLFCKTNQPQSIMHLETTSPWGRTLNPHNINLSAGGSTGGEAALIALRGSVLGVGTDIGGSVRGPAGFCGIYGLKTTSYVFPQKDFLPGGFAAELNVLCSAGPMCTSLRDVDLLMSIVSGTRPWLKDPRLVPLHWTGRLTENKPLKIGLMINDGIITPQPPVTRALEWAARELRSKGFDVKPFLPYGMAEAMNGIRRAYWPDGGKTVKEYLSATNEPMSPLTKWIIQDAEGPGLDANGVLKLRVERDDFRCRFAEHWESQDVDFVICPVFVGPACSHETALYWNYTALWNYVDYPGIVIPTPIKAGAKGTESYPPNSVPLIRLSADIAAGERSGAVECVFSDVRSAPAFDPAPFAHEPAPPREGIDGSLGEPFVQAQHQKSDINSSAYRVNLTSTDDDYPKYEASSSPSPDRRGGYRDGPRPSHGQWQNDPVSLEAYARPMDAIEEWFSCLSDSYDSDFDDLDDEVLSDASFPGLSISDSTVSQDEAPETWESQSVMRPEKPVQNQQNRQLHAPLAILSLPLPQDLEHQSPVASPGILQGHNRESLSLGENSGNDLKFQTQSSANYSQPGTYHYKLDSDSGPQWMNAFAGPGCRQENRQIYTINASLCKELAKKPPIGWIHHNPIKIGKGNTVNMAAGVQAPKKPIELPDPATLSIRSPTPSSSATVSSDIDVDSISADSEGKVDRSSRGYCVFSRVFSRLSILGQNEVTARGESSCSRSKGKQVAKGGSGSSSATRDAANTRGGRKNRRQDGDLRDESRDRQNEPPKKKGKISQSHCDERSQFLACPYWKADSKKYWDCFLKKNDTIAHLKQHLTRRHTPKYYCQICYQTFRDFDLFDSHALQRSCTRGPSAKLEGISQQQKNQLSLKSKGSVEQQWCTVWSILFPDMEPPATIYIYSTQSEDFCRIQEFAQREGVAIMLDELESNGLVVRPDASYQLLRSAVQRAMVLIFRSYSVRSEPTSETEEQVLSQALEPDTGVSLQQGSTVEGPTGHGNHPSSSIDIEQRYMVTIANHDFMAS
ncbi:hypothetical protein FANTH_2184 [Fusarium anthophilum]|uniref:Amidase domain-containing protein n=1 Tax=Fusarium anthophilum TaxID=48485 RepID=A0A8H5EA75_9HYPO|nr:hypothetical protein FANTH_2184 [Fusarium anthophilum]